jgi:hypothetical protein
MFALRGFKTVVVDRISGGGMVILQRVVLRNVSQKAGGGGAGRRNLALTVVMLVMLVMLVMPVSVSMLVLMGREVGWKEMQHRMVLMGALKISPLARPAVCPKAEGGGHGERGGGWIETIRAGGLDLCLG